MVLALQPPLRLPPGPQTATRTACEVLTWRALGRLRTKPDLDAEAESSRDRWTDGNREYVQRALEARARPEPFCAVERHLTQWGAAANEDHHYADRILSPGGPRTLRLIRSRARRRLGYLIGYGELAAMLAIERQTDTQEDAWLEQAAGSIMQALRAGRITALGQPSLADGNPNRASPHVMVPLGVMVHDAVTVDIWNVIGADREGDGAVWVQRKPLTYHDVRFQTAEVLKLWPMKIPSRVTLHDLPADWTLLECVAWVLLRDPTAVHAMAPETARGRGASRWQDPSHQTRWHEVDWLGPDGSSLLWLRLTWAYCHVGNPDAHGRGNATAMQEAIEAALIALRAGRLEATGTLRGGNRQQMQAADWRGLRLLESDRGELWAEPEREMGRHWRDVTIPMRKILAEWPAAATTSDAELAPGGDVTSDHTGSAGRPTSKHLVEAEYQRRIAADKDCGSIGEQGKALSDWLKSAHASMAPLTPRSAENAIRPAFNKRKSGARNKTPG